MYEYNRPLHFLTLIVYVSGLIKNRHVEVGLIYPNGVFLANASKVICSICNIEKPLIR